MGIYDRDYYRNDRRSPMIGSIVALGPMTGLWAATCVVVFAIQLIMSASTQSQFSVVQAFQLQPNRALSGEWWQFATYAFVDRTSGAWLSITINLVMVLWFASEAEAILGTWDYLCFLLTSILLGGIVFAVCGFLGVLGATPSRVLIGMSTAIIATLVFIGSTNPWRSIILFGVLEVPIWAFVCMLAGKEILTIRGRPLFNLEVIGPLIAVGIYGFGYARTGFRLSDVITSWTKRGERKSSSLASIDHLPQSATQDSKPHHDVITDEHLEAKLDAVLEKMAAHGVSSLGEEEKQILLKASEIYRRRRQGESRPDLL